MATIVVSAATTLRLRHPKKPGFSSISEMNPNKPIHLIAHSQGTSVAEKALWLIDAKNRSNISYQGFGGQVYVGGGIVGKKWGLASTYNVIHYKDPVPNSASMLEYAAQSGLYSNPSLKVINSKGVLVKPSELTAEEKQGILPRFNMIGNLFRDIDAHGWQGRDDFGELEIKENFKGYYNYIQDPNQATKPN